MYRGYLGSSSVCLEKSLAKSIGLNIFFEPHTINGTQIHLHVITFTYSIDINSLQL